jgi:hypothetical protein
MTFSFSKKIFAMESSNMYLRNYTIKTLKIYYIVREENKQHVKGQELDIISYPNNKFGNSTA